LSLIDKHQYRDKTPPPDNASWAAHYALASPPLRKHIRNTLMPGSGKAEFERWVMKALPWRFFARTDQVAPQGDWMTWLLQAGRGAGKTRTGAEWSWEQVHRWPGFLHAVVSPTFDDLDKVTFDGPSGLMRLVERFPNRVRKVIRRPWRIDFMNGSRITSFTGEATERLRGPEHNGAWIDELAGMGKAADEVYTQASFGLRRVGPKGQQPRMLLTSTPKPLPLFRTLNARFAAGDPAVVITRASTMDNFANLSSHAIEELRGRYDGTRLGRQELLGELLMDVPGALWTADMFQRASMPTRLDRVVVGVDPSGAANPLSKSDAIGIVVVGVTFGKTKTEDRFYVLEDATLVASPNQWSARVAKAYEDWDADRVVAEGNFGGAMVESVIKSAAPNIPVKLVTATRGKVVRAEPIAALYEQSRVYHVGMFPSMEDEMMAITVTGYTGESSPDRADAAIWGVTDLMSRVAAPSAEVLGGSRPSPWRPSV
jgi:phage terminase large subunit-like protein